RTPDRRTLPRHAHRVSDHACGSGVCAASPAFGRERVPGERHSRAAPVGGSARSASRRTVIESADRDETEGRRDPAKPANTTGAEKYVDCARARSDEITGRGAYREASGGSSRNQRQDGGSAQVQPDAQTRHSQQGPAGHGRHPEEDSSDAGLDELEPCPVNLRHEWVVILSEAKDLFFQQWGKAGPSLRSG